jgi:hypothetical protein
MPRRLFRLVLWFFCIAPFASYAAAADETSFARQIFPILTAKCQGCHLPTLRSGGMMVTSFSDFQKGGRKGPSFIPGKPDESIVIKHLSGALEPRMPMGMDPLAPSEIELFRRWIGEGARDDTASGDADPIPAAPPVYQASPVITALAYSPDGALLAVSGNHEILLHKADGTGIAARLAGRAERIQALVYSKDGKMLVAVGGSPARFGEIQFWDVAHNKLLRSIKLGSDTLLSAAFSPDDKYLAVGCPDKTVRIFDTATGEAIKKMENHEDWVFGTVFSVDGKRLVSVSRDHFVKLSEVASGSFLENLNLLTKATFGGHGELYCVVAAGSDRTPRMYTMHRPRAMKIDDDSCLLREFPVQAGPVQCARFSPDGTLVAVGGMGDEINIYRAENAEKVTTLKGHKGGIYALDFHPSGTQISASGFDGIVRIYELKSNSLLKDFVPVPIAAASASAR